MSNCRDSTLDEFFGELDEMTRMAKQPQFEAFKAQRKKKPLSLTLTIRTYCAPRTNSLGR
jgi:hypothetical protein